MTRFQEKVYRAVSQIPVGQTTTYKRLAEFIGHPRAYRAVGHALNKNRDFKNIPCHRVICSDGQAGGYVRGRKKKIELLTSENSFKISGWKRRAGSRGTALV